MCQCCYTLYRGTHIVHKSLDMVVVAVAGPCAIVSASMECLNVLQGSATGLEVGWGDRYTSIYTHNRLFCHTLDTLPNTPFGEMTLSETMFSCQVMDVFDATLQKCSYTRTEGVYGHTFYMWRIHKYLTTCQLPAGTLYVESVPIHMSIHPLCTCVGSVPTRFLRMTVCISKFWILHAHAMHLFLSKLHTNYKT